LPTAKPFAHGFGGRAKGARRRFNAMLLRIAHDLEA
jgi:hypothetical protein